MWTSIAVDNDNIGAFLDRGELGVEAYDDTDTLIGVFSDTDTAGYAIEGCWDRKCRLNGGTSTADEEPQPNGENLTFLPRGMFGVEAFDNGISLGLFPDRKPAIDSWKRGGRVTAASHTHAGRCAGLCQTTRLEIVSGAHGRRQKVQLAVEANMPLVARTGA